MKSKTLNMTEGNPVQLILIFAVPMLIGNVFQQLYNLVDSVIVGKFVGAEALASIGATNAVTFMFFALCNGIASGGGIITAQQFGAGNKDNIKKAIVNSAYILLTGSVVIGAIAFAICPTALRLMATPEDILQNAIVYMRMQCLGLPLIAIYNHVSSMLRALGDTRTPLYFLIFSCILNAGMDLYFVCVLGMGIFGAALATIIAQFISGMSCLVYALKTSEYFKFEKKDFAPEKQMLIGTVRLGVPLSLQFSLIAVSTMALQRVVNTFGTTVMAAFTATSRVEQLLHQPYGTLSAALATYAGQNLGAKNLDRIKLGVKKGMLMMSVFSLFMLPVMQFFSDEIISIFVSDAEVIVYGSTGMIITSWFYLALGTIYVIRGTLNGVGDAMFALINGVVEVIGRIVIPVTLITIPAIGVWGLWGSAAVVWVISALFSIWRYASWRKKNPLIE